MEAEKSERLKLFFAKMETMNEFAKTLVLCCLYSNNQKKLLVLSYEFDKYQNEFSL